MNTDELIKWIHRQHRRGHSMKEIFDFGISLGLDAYTINQATNIYNKRVQQKSGLLGQISKQTEIGILCGLLGVLILVASGLAFSLMDSVSEATVSGALLHPEDHLFQHTYQGVSLSEDSAVESAEPYVASTYTPLVYTQDESFENSDGSTGPSADSLADSPVIESSLVIPVNRTYIEAYWNPAITAALEPFDTIAVTIGTDRHVAYLEDGELIDIDEYSLRDADLELYILDKGDLAYCKRALEQRVNIGSCLEKADVPYYLYPGMVSRAESVLDA